MIAASGAFHLTGSPTSSTYTLAAASGAFHLTGNPASLTYGRVLAAASGAFNLTGSPASFPYRRTLAAASGAFNLTGGDATLTVHTPALFTGVEILHHHYPVSSVVYPFQGLEFRVFFSAPPTTATLFVAFKNMSGSSALTTIYLQPIGAYWRGVWCGAAQMQSLLVWSISADGVSIASGQLTLGFLR
jgi:hypothetical protein